MCTDHQHRDDHKGSHAHESHALVLRVEDMTCGHCAGAIKNAIESTLPGTKVHADPESKLVKVSGPADLARLHEIVTSAGYTPSVAPSHA